MGIEKNTLIKSTRSSFFKPRAVTSIIEDYVNNQNYLTSLTSIIQVGIMSVTDDITELKFAAP